MQVNPAYLRHIWMKECQTGVEWRIQRESAVSSALALRPQFSIHGNVLERAKVFKYLGCLLAQDNDNAQAVRKQLQKARGVWACVGQVLCGENTDPRVAAKFYKAVIQAVLFYGRETWNLSKSTLTRLEGFHMHAAYKMVRKHQPRRGANGTWVYLKTKDALEECGLATLVEYIQVRRQTIVTYIAMRPNLTACMEGKRRRGLIPRQWWWEQPMCLNATNDAIGSNGSNGHPVAPTAADA